MEKIIWRKIEGYEDYYVSNTGQVGSTKQRGFKILRQHTWGRGYLCLKLKKDGKEIYWAVARLVARAFPEICGEWFEGCTVDHINTIKTDNRAENLRVCTMKDNLNNPLTLDNMRKYKTEEERKAAEKEQKRIERQNNKEYYKKYHREYYQKHKEEFKEYYREYARKHYRNNKDYYKEYYEKNKEKILKKQKEKYLAKKQSKEQVEVLLKKVG